MTPDEQQLTRHIRQMLYMLKRQYPGAIVIYSLNSSETDPLTGETEVQATFTRIRRAIVMPVKVFRELKQGISLVSGNKTLVMGGYYDAGTRLFIVDRRDAPSLQLRLEDWIVYRDRRYSIENIQAFELDAAWIITGRELVGSQPGNVHNLTTDNFVQIESEAIEQE